jgi:hypothetical protein
MPVHLVHGAAANLSLPEKCKMHLCQIWDGSWLRHQNWYYSNQHHQNNNNNNNNHLSEEEPENDPAETTTSTNAVLSYDYTAVPVAAVSQLVRLGGMMDCGCVHMPYIRLVHLDRGRLWAAAWHGRPCTGSTSAHTSSTVSKIRLAAVVQRNHCRRQHPSCMDQATGIKEIVYL